MIVLAALSSNFAQAGNLVGTVDRNKIGINESLNFTLSYDEQVATDNLELGTIRQDFDIVGLRPQSSSNISIINGKTTRQISTTWALTLVPKREGTLVIPSFNINGDVSDAIPIEVSAASSQSVEDQSIQASLTVDKQAAYEGEQILVKIQLLAKQSVGSLQGQELKIADAEIQLLDQQNFSRVENGISWQVTEWTYAVFPEKAGILAIPAQYFSGVLSTGNRSRGAFGSFFEPSGERIGARSSALAIEIQPAEVSVDQSWLPASKVQIQSQWSGDTAQIRVGEPITRTVEIAALGQRSNVIPPLPESDSSLYKAYKDQPQLEDRVSADYGVIGIRRESQAIVPSAEGSLTLPEQRISWWDNQSKSWQEAVLAAETVTVLSAVNEINFAPPSSAPQFLPDTAQAQLPIAETTEPLWQWTTVALAILCLIQFWIILRRKPSDVHDKESLRKKESNPSEKQTWKQLNSAIRSNDTGKIRAAILKWARTYFHQQPNLSFHSLLSAADYDNSDNLKTQLNALDASLYKDQTQVDTAQLKLCLTEFREELESAREADKKSNRVGSLKPLYPV